MSSLEERSLFRSRGDAVPSPDRPDHLLEHLKARINDSLADLNSATAEGFLSLVLELPPLPGHLPSLAGPQFLFRHVHRAEQRLGYGIAQEWSAAGPERLANLRAQALSLASAWRQLDPDDTGFQGFAFLGFAARPTEDLDPSPNDLPNALLRIPELALCTRRGRAVLVFTAPLPTKRARLLLRWSALLDRLIPALATPTSRPQGPIFIRRHSEIPGASGWERLLAKALDRIEAGELRKVVLARQLRIEGSRDFDLDRLLDALGQAYPSCQVLSIRHGTSHFVAATPERLLSLRGNRVEVDALAGTTRRAVEAERDGALAQEMRDSTKCLHEHELVIQAIRDALQGQARHIEVAPQPDIMRLSNVQHLWTRISATFDRPTDVFTLAELLHPTPATNGQPRRRASAWLRHHDPLKRGWYTGAAGIIEPDLSGELWVLLRCADIQARTADLFAGGGIVQGSDPDQEWRETEHKLDAMLSALRLA